MIDLLLIVQFFESMWMSYPFESNEGSLSDRQAVLFISTLFIVAGLALLRWEAKEPIQKALMYLRMRSFTPGNTTNGNRLVGISGTISAAEETLTAPLTETEAVSYLTVEQVLERERKYDREERVRRKASDVHDDDDARKRVTTWKTDEATGESVPFTLETKHGHVRVDPGQASLQMPVRETDIPSLPKRLLSNIVSVMTLGRIGGVNQRTKERYFQPGDEVLVIGDLTASEESDEYVATVDSPGANDLFTVTDRSGRSLAMQSTLVAMGSSLPGLALTLLGVGFLIGGIALGVV